MDLQGSEWPFQSLASLDWKTIIILLLVAPFLLTYLYTFFRSIVQLRSAKNGRTPPAVPYTIPFLGHALSFAQNPGPFLERIISQYGYSQPVSIRTGPVKMTVPADPRQNEILLRASRDLTNKPSMILALRNLFGVPIRALKYYEADDSGTMPKPAVGSNIRPEDRIFFHQHHSAHKYLTGHALNLMTERLIDNFERQVLMADLGHDWTTMPNFWLFFRSMMFEASIEALFGKHMLSLNPELREDFWEFDRHGLSILKGLPPWTNPSGYGARKRAISAVKKWHQFASEHVDATKVSADDPEWEPYWGAKVFKARQQYMGEMHFLDQDAKASEDLGFMFAANANAIPAAGWMALNAFLDPLLLKRARQEVEDCFQDQISTNGTRKLDLTKLCSKPLLQSMYAETLRLCAGIVVGRTPRDGPYKLGEWMFPQGDLILLSARTSAMNPEIWNTGSAEEPHPLDSFWADRFIVYPHDPKSGPLKNPPPSNAKVQSPEFSMRGLTGAWFPYGGGVTMCPGRHFAKQEMIAGMAVLIASYDIEFKVANDFVPQADFSYFPMGILPIKDQIPFRIRKRAST